MILCVGFVLDESINSIETTGWEMLESIIYGESFLDKTLVRLSEKINN